LKTCRFSMCNWAMLFGMKVASFFKFKKFRPNCESRSVPPKTANKSVPPVFLCNQHFGVRSGASLCRSNLFIPWSGIVLYLFLLNSVGFRPKCKSSGGGIFLISVPSGYGKSVHHQWRRRFRHLVHEMV
jgi:hypothetical protein